MIKWYADCDECTISHHTPNDRSHLVMAFDDQTERTVWVKEHRKTTGHTVFQYHRRLPDPVIEA